MRVGAWVLASWLQDAAWLEWVAPPGCTTAATVIGRVETLVSVPMDSSVRARGEVTHENGAPHLRLELIREGLADVRTIDAPRCEELERAAAVLIAVAIDPEAALRAPLEVAPDSASTPADSAPSEPKSLRPAEPEPEPEAQSPAAPTKRSRVDTRPFATGTVAGNLTWGPLPSGGAGISFGVNVVSAWVRGALLLHGAWGFRPATVDLGAVQMTLWTAQLAVCFRARPGGSGRSEFPICASPELGINHANTEDAAQLRDGTGFWVAALAGFGWIWPVDAPAALRLGADVGGVLYRKAYDAGEMSVFRPAPWVVRVHAGVEIVLGRVRDNGSSVRRR